MAEIRANWRQNGDMHKSVKIERVIKLFITKSYVMVLFLCHSMFNTIFTKKNFKTWFFGKKLVFDCSQYEGNGS